MANGAGNRTEAPPRGRLLRIGVAVAAIVAIDQLTKAWVAATRKDAPLDIIGNSVQIVLSRNGGSAFGRFQGMTTLLAVGAIVVSVLIVREARNATDRLRLIGFTLVLGGALGNLSDRFFRAPGFLARTRRRLRRGRSLPGVQRRGLVHHDRGDHPRVGHVARTREVSEHEPVEVPAALDGERVDRAVALLTGWSRGDVQTLLADGGVLVDGRAVGKSRRLHEGEIVEVRGEPVPDAPPVAEPDVDVTVRYEDDDVIVVAKPAGLVVHPGAGHSSGTLVHGLLARYPEIAGVGDPYRPGIVHRLDRDTSGLMVVARRPPAYDALVEQLSARAVDRRYAALVWGRPAATRGTIDAPIGRSSARRTRMAVRDAGRPARTGYEVERTFDEPTLQPARVHARDRSHPSDPRPSRRDRSSRGRRRDVRRSPRLDRPRSSVPPRGASRLHASRVGCAGRVRRTVAAGAGGGPRRAGPRKPEPRRRSGRARRSGRRACAGPGPRA